MRRVSKYYLCMKIQVTIPFNEKFSSKINFFDEVFNYMQMLHNVFAKHFSYNQRKNFICVKYKNKTTLFEIF